MNKDRKALFLTSTILRGRVLRSPGEGGARAEAALDALENADSTEGVEFSDGFDGALDRRNGKGKPATEKPAKKAAAAEEAGEDGEDDGEGAGEGEDDGEGEEEADDTKEKGKKPAKTAKERIAEKTRKIRQMERDHENERRGWEARFSALEERVLQGKPGDANDGGAEENPAPDPTDLEKYPLGSLDDRYVEDKLEWLSDKKVSDKLSSVLRREQERDQQAEAERLLTDLRSKAADMAERGSEQFDDYEEVVVEAAMGQKFPLQQATFEAASEAEHGVQILYDLASDLDEAKRVAALSPFKQMQFVVERNNEIAGKKKPKLPKAGDPPSNNAPRGRGGTFGVATDTEDTAAFAREFNKN